MPPANDMKKYSLKFVTFYFKRDTSISMLELFPAIVFKKRIGYNTITHTVNFDIQRDIAKNGPRSRYIDITLSIESIWILYIDRQL